MLPILLALLAAAPARAITSITQAGLARTADERACSLGPPSVQFRADDRQVFLRFVAVGVAPDDKLAVEWLDPRGSVALATPWGALPRAASLCFLTQLPVAGFDAESSPGRWTARVVVNGAVVWSRGFDIAPDPAAGQVRIASVARRALPGGDMEITAEGRGFDSATILHVAQYSASGWQYVAALTPSEAAPRRLVARGRPLAPGEYMVLAYSGSARLSPPARLLVSASNGYRLPFKAGEPWIVTQGPYGSFSHFNRSLHAFDIAPARGTCIVAMRGGVVHAFDGGWGQTPHLRIFGNYITVEHGDGEFSHYGHLRAGSMVVRTGQRVEQGQALATVGNSGYTIGPGGGHHVHVHVTRAFSISAQSVPFRFEDMPDPRTRGVVVSKNSHPDCECSRAKPAPSAPARTWQASVAVAESWTDLLRVPRGTQSLDLSLAWTGADRDMSLAVVSPGGHRYGWFDDPSPLSRPSGSAQRFSLTSPEPGTWRVVVHGMRGTGERMPFSLSHN